MNIETIQNIISVFEDSSLAKMELEVDDMKIKMEKSNGEHIAPIAYEYKTPKIKEQTPVKEAPVEKSGTWVKAPIVGTFYNSAGSGSAPYITIGKHVKKGDILCIIEAMKVMNEIHSPVDGVISEILVTNDSMVEFDQDLIRIGEAND